MRNALNLHSSSELNYQISKLSMQVQTKAKSLQDDEKRLKKLKRLSKKGKWDGKLSPTWTRKDMQDFGFIAKKKTTNKIYQGRRPAPKEWNWFSHKA